jgi:hypothetical protein
MVDRYTNAVAIFGVRILEIEQSRRLRDNWMRVGRM